MEKFKPIRPILSASSARSLLGGKSQNLDSQKLFWIQNWLEQKAREQMLPPQIYGKEAYASLLRFLAPADALLLLKLLRLEYAQQYPPLEVKKDEELEKQILYSNHSPLLGELSTTDETSFCRASQCSEESED